MLHPNSLDAMAPVTPPRDCVVSFQIGTRRTLLVSYDRHGESFEEFVTSPDRATAAVEAALLHRVRKHDTTRLKLA